MRNRGSPNPGAYLQADSTKMHRSASRNLLSSTASIRSDSRVGAVPRFRFGAAEIVTLCLYAGLLAWAIPHHEPWADEAQAWQIARTLPPAQIFHLLSYEGHPGLWYLCLWALSRLHVSYTGMRCFAAAIAFLGVAVLVTASPFPRFIKLLLPFTFYLAFQYAIVARSYVLVPLLIFLCAYFWPQDCRALSDCFLPGTTSQCRGPRRSDLGWAGHCLPHRPVARAAST